MNMLIILIVVGLPVYAGFLQFRHEKEEWNSGTCKDNGLPWESFDTDSQGSIGFKAGDQTLWISYHRFIIKQEKTK